MSNSVCNLTVINKLNLTVINKLERLGSGSPIYCESRAWLQTELDDTNPVFQLIITITISEKN